jgi:hypothetical protein
MKHAKASRKRTLDDENSDPCRFLHAYYSERGIPESPDDDALLLDDCVRRAEHARESFKRWRAADDGGDALSATDVDCATPAPLPERRGLADAAEAVVARLLESDGPPAAGAADDKAHVNVALLTPHEKYQRRLVNNRRSAAAARVYQEVLRREHTHALRNVSDERNKLKSDVDRLQDSLRKLREENERLADVERAAESQKIAKVEGSDRESFLDAFMGASSDKAYATVTAAAFLPVVTPATTEETMANLSRALLPMFGSQSQSQDDNDEKIGLMRPAGPSLSFGIFNSQASQPDSFLAVRGGSGPGALDELAETSDLFSSSQLLPSQVLASQGSGSQGSGCQGVTLSQGLGIGSQGPSPPLGIASQSV